MLLAFTDLLFFVAVPMLIAFSLEESVDSGWQVKLSAFGDMLSLTREELTIFLVILLSIARTLVVKNLAKIFSSSLSSSYSEVSNTFVESFFSSVSDVKILDIGRFRKVMNAETNNLFFGVLVSSSFALAEILIVFVAILVLLAILGGAVLYVFLPVAAFLLGVMLLMRKHSRLIGQQRAKSEQRRLESVELLINSGYSIAVNGGTGAFNHDFNLVTRSFTGSLSKQLVMPFYTKSFVDGVLMVVLTSLLILYSGSVGTLDLAILLGIGLRCVPALSRISAYVETVRINLVGANDALTLTKDLRRSDVSVYENDSVMEFLKSITSAGLFIIKGPSGTGKTSAIKKWILSSENSRLAYFDQGGFSQNTDLQDLLDLIGAVDCADFCDIDFIRDRAHVKLSSLSGGQARYVQLFALLAKEVDCVVLDEPSVGLDAGLRANLEALIVDKSRSVPTVVISHDNEFISSLRGSGGQLFEV